MLPQNEVLYGVPVFLLCLHYNQLSPAFNRLMRNSYKSAGLEACFENISLSFLRVIE